MKLRPCIDIHNGRVKQIIGGTLADQGDRAAENFVAEKSAADHARMFRELGLFGGHVIALNGKDSPYYAATKEEVLSSLRAFPGGLAAGGGITPENAEEYLDTGASHVIVTSYLFEDGRLSGDRIRSMLECTGKERLVIDLSCRKKDGIYYVVTDRWQTFTETRVTPALLAEMAGLCDEFLIHGVDAEGKRSGIEDDLLRILADAARLLPERERACITYAGGIASFEDIRKVFSLSGGRIDITIGSALSCYGGDLSLPEILSFLSGLQDN